MRNPTQDRARGQTADGCGVGALGRSGAARALYADLREFEEADRIYQRALREYHDMSPFAVAWVCFQLGVLWGELVPEAQSARAAIWYREAIDICRVM